MPKDPLEKMMAVGVKAEDGDGSQKKPEAEGDTRRLASSATLPDVRCGSDPASVPVTKSQRQTFTGFQATHFHLK